MSQHVSTEAQLLDMIHERDEKIAHLQGVAVDLGAEHPSQILYTYKQLFGMARDRDQDIDALEGELARKDFDALVDHNTLTSRLESAEVKFNKMKMKYIASLKRERGLARKLAEVEARARLETEELQSVYRSGQILQLI